MNAEPLTLRDIIVRVGRERAAAPILDLPSLDIAPGERIGIAGPSGSGKTTLLHVIAGLQAVSAGSVAWNGTILSALREAARDQWRRRHVGMVFQDFLLVPELSALANVLLPTRFVATGIPRTQAMELLERVGITTPDRRAGQLSPGEQQRVGIARALIGTPRLILADEPTASLDAANAAMIRDLLIDSASRLKATLIVVSHDEALLGRMARTLRLEKGRLA